MKSVVTRPVIRPVDIDEAKVLEDLLVQYSAKERHLPGISEPSYLLSFLGQLIESGRRRRYAERQSRRIATARVLDARSGAFDPIMAAVREHDAGNFDNACWLVFLSVHFGRPKKTQWALVSEFYSRLAQGGTWDWNTVQSDVPAVRKWIEENRGTLRERGGTFGNHRKYESLGGLSAGGTGEVIETYVDWVDGSHEQRFASLIDLQDGPRGAFAAVYKSMDSVARFGRTARFDYLTMLGKLGIASFEPDKAYYLRDSGPTKGAKLLFLGSADASSPTGDLEAFTAELGDALGLTFDILEDALCNWQKSPGNFTAFRG